ncbi:hypothetical protein [Ruegeria sp. Ofav3-42]|uniref:hypothetical protein n=1 Tax=Ruegeria sp. Ofav3-42 TaxID=2917759 RepID=UPI001EF73D76|nr:hypothetical protein [Ruegeria sp. Ofav3-42]MCG7518466.1 hypothetical protein [Ruegeria sp. Ofav3-42]
MDDAELKAPRSCIICMKWGDAFGADYVNTLYCAVKDHLSLDHDFICITDNPEGLAAGIKTHPLRFPQLERDQWIHGKWPKVLMFDRQIVGGYDAALFLDLDLVVTGNLDPLLAIVMEKGGLYLMPKFRGLIWRLIPAAIWDQIPRIMNKVTRGNSSVVGFVPAEQFHLCDDFDSATDLPRYENDQNYISALAKDRKCYPKNWCIGIIHLVYYWPFGLIFKRYKRRPGRPKIVIFNGRPNPAELIDDSIGYWGTRRRRAHGGIEWVADYLERYST